MSEPIKKAEVIKEVEATKTLKVIQEGKNKKLLELIPEGHSPKLYLDLIKEQIFIPDRAGKPRRDEDLLLFLYVCKRTGLDPLTKQVYAVFRWSTRYGRDTMVIQSGIDGMRLVAQRTGQYAGSDDIKYTPEDEIAKYPIKATATVYKIISGARVAFTATARWIEYVQTDNKTGKPNDMWEKMPYNQLGKCAEALALRKGFPNELSGIYSDDEMQQANNILGDLTAPDRFKKPEESIEVVHGAPEIEKPVEDKPKEIGNPEAAKQPKKPEKIEEPNVEQVEPDLGAMQEKLKTQSKQKTIEGREAIIKRVAQSRQLAKEVKAE